MLAKFNCSKLQQRPVATQPNWFGPSPKPVVNSTSGSYDWMIFFCFAPNLFCHRQDTPPVGHLQGVQVQWKFGPGRDPGRGRGIGCQPSIGSCKISFGSRSISIFDLDVRKADDFIKITQTAEKCSILRAQIPSGWVKRNWLQAWSV